jgi:hypothetical protein
MNNVPVASSSRCSCKSGAVGVTALPADLFCFLERSNSQTAIIMRLPAPTATLKARPAFGPVLRPVGLGIIWLGVLVSVGLTDRTDVDVRLELFVEGCQVTPI